MKLDLTIKERLVLLTILPSKSDKMTQVISHEITNKVRFSEQDFEKYEMKTDSNGLSWNDAHNDTLFTIDFSESELIVLKEQSAHLDREKQITKDMLSLIKKIDAA